jgi:hypothetical protein
MRAIWTAILLMPACVAAESQTATSTQNTLASATARVEFKIVIPPILSLRLTDGAASIVTNSRSPISHAPCVLDRVVSRLICTAAAP